MTPLARAAFSLPGAGGTVVLVHGLGGGPYELQWLGEALHARLGLSVEAVLLPGHEVAQPRMPASRHEQWCQAVQDLVVRRSSAGGPLHLVGFSTGAMVCLRVAQRVAVSGRLVLLAPFVAVARPALLPVAPEVLLSTFSFLGQVPRRGPPLKDLQLRREVTACLPFKTFNLHAARSAVDLAQVVEAELARVLAPALILQGARDTVVDPSATRRLARGLPGVVKLVELPLSDHLLALDVERQRVEDEVVAFLSDAAQPS